MHIFPTPPRVSIGYIGMKQGIFRKIAGFFARSDGSVSRTSEAASVADGSGWLSALRQASGTDGTSFACIDRIASEFALLNWAVYDSKTREKLRDNPLHALISRPNDEDGHFNFFYQSVQDYFSGGVFWLKTMLGGRCVSLYRLDPASVTMTRNAGSGKRVFTYLGKKLAPEEVVYIPARFGYTALYGGKSIFRACPTVFDTVRELDSFTKSSFSNGVSGKRLVIDVQGAFPEITAEQSKQLKDSFQREYSGAENACRPILKKKGFEFSELGTAADNKAAELSENRRIQEHEIAKIFGVPEGILTVSKDTNLENVFTLFCEFAIRPMATQFQEAINSLATGNAFFEFDYNGIMKVSMQQRIDAYVKQITNGLLSPDEARAKENLGPIEAGSNHFMPVNLMPLNEETIKAYMAKQKNEINGNGGAENPTDPGAQHFPGGDDKQ